MGNFAENMLCDKSSSHGVTETRRQQLRRAEVLATNRLAVKQPTTSKSCDTEKQLSKPAQPNEPGHINNQEGSSTRTTWFKKRRKRNILAENRKKKKCHQSQAVAADDRNENKLEVS